MICDGWTKTLPHQGGENKRGFSLRLVRREVVLENQFVAVLVLTQPRGIVFCQLPFALCL